MRHLNGIVKNKRYLILSLAICFIIIITAIAYSPCLKNGFVWDDEVYILKNYLIKNISMDNLKAILTTPVMGNYHPLVIISYAWEYFFFKLNPIPYHAVNLILHLLNCVVVFFFILRLSRSIPVAFITGLLFGIHPLHVESVAWISERKDVLYTFFYIISLICYLSYLEKKSERKYYLFTLFFFLLSILSKPMAVTLPLVLFTMDYIRDRKIGYRTIVEKIPFFIFSILSGVVTLFAQQPATHSESVFSFPISIIVAFHGYIFYLFKMIFPLKLAALYRYPIDGNLFSHFQYIAAPAIFSALALAVFYSARYTKKVAWGSSFYFITLLPVIQLLPIGLAVASDRYTYVPLIGIFYVVSEFFVWTWHRTFRNHFYWKIITIVIALAIIIQSVFLTQNLCKIWKDGISLWSNVVKHYPQNDVAFNNLGSEFFALKEYDKALHNFQTVIEINPQYGRAYANICAVYFSKNEPEKALPYCEKALQINTAQPNTYIILGDIYWSKDKSLSVEMYKKSVSFSSHYPAGYNRLCKAYMTLQEYDDAYPVCLETIVYNPDDTAFCNYIGNLYLNAGQYTRAIFFYMHALEINPNLPEVHNNLSVLYYYSKDYKSSIRHFNAAVALGHKIDPEFKNLISQIQKNLADSSK